MAPAVSWAWPACPWRLQRPLATTPTTTTHRATRGTSTYTSGSGRLQVHVGPIASLPPCYSSSLTHSHGLDAATAPASARRLSTTPRRPAALLWFWRTAATAGHKSAHHTDCLPRPRSSAPLTQSWGPAWQPCRSSHCHAPSAASIAGGRPNSHTPCRPGPRAALCTGHPSSPRRAAYRRPPRPARRTRPSRPRLRLRDRGSVDPQRRDKAGGPCPRAQLFRLCLPCGTSDVSRCPTWRPCTASRRLCTMRRSRPARQSLCTARCLAHLTFRPCRNRRPHRQPGATTSPLTLGGIAPALRHGGSRQCATAPTWWTPSQTRQR